MGLGAGSTCGVREQDLKAWGLRGEAEECLDDFLCFLALPDFEDKDFNLDDKHLGEQLRG